MPDVQPGAFPDSPAKLPFLAQRLHPPQFDVATDLTAGLQSYRLQQSPQSQPFGGGLGGAGGGIGSSWSTYTVDCCPTKLLYGEGLISHAGSR